MNSKPDNDNDNIKQLINKLIEDIIVTEDKISILTKSLTSHDQEKQIQYADHLNFDFSKNIQTIQMLKHFILSETEDTRKEIQKREDERSNLNKVICELEKEIAELTIKEKDTEQSEEIRLNMLEEMIQQKKQTEELKNLEKILSENEDTRQDIENSLTHLSNMKKEIEECLSMLREERLSVEAQIINSISQKESLEEIVKFNMISFYKNLTFSTESVTHSVAVMTNIEIFPYEIEKVNASKMTDHIYELLSDFFSSNNSNPSNKIPPIDKPGLLHQIKKLIEDFANTSNQKMLYSPDDFFTLLTKKICDMFCKIQKDRAKEINPEKLKLLMKYLTKINYYEILISDKITFINKEYKIVKKEKLEKITDINTKINKSLAKFDEIEFKEKEIRQKIDSILEASTMNTKDHDPHYDDILTKFNKKVSTLVDFKQELEKDVLVLMQKSKKNIQAYEDQIKEIEKVNEQLLDKKKEIDKQLEQSTLSTNEKIIQLRETIAEKFQIIKNHLQEYKGGNSPSNSKMKFLNEYVDKIKETLRSGNINPQMNEISYKINKRYQGRSSSNDNCSYEQPSENEMSKLDYIKEFENSVLKTVKERRNTSNRSADASQEDISPRKNKFSPNVIYKPKRSVGTFEGRSRSARSKSKNEFENAQEKLETTINSLKNKIITKQNYSQHISDDKDIILSKIKPLLSPTFCYLRAVKDKNQVQKFNPIEAYSPEQYGFIKYTISLDQKISKLLFYKNPPRGNKLKVHFEIKLIDVINTAVTNTIKNILTIYNSFKQKQNEIANIEDFVRREEFSKIEFDFNSRIKCVFNKYFNFSLLLSSGARVELIFLNYEEFKNWLNGFACLIKHKNEVDELRNQIN